MDAFIRDEVGLVRAIAVKVSYMHTQKCYIIYHPYRSDLPPNERNFLELCKLRKLLRRLSLA